MTADDLIPAQLRTVCFALVNELSRLSSGHPEGSADRVASALCLMPEPLWDELLDALPLERSDEIQRLARRRAPEADVERFKTLLGALGVGFEERQRVQRSGRGVAPEIALDWLITLHPRGAREALCFHADGRYVGRREAAGAIVVPELADPEDLAFADIEREVRQVLQWDDPDTPGGG